MTSPRTARILSEDDSFNAETLSERDVLPLFQARELAWQGRVIREAGLCQAGQLISAEQRPWLKERTTQSSSTSASASSSSS